LKCDSATILVHDWTSRTSSTGGGVGLVVARVEVAVALSIFWGVSIETADDA
jgi:hypothetical protein